MSVNIVLTGLMGAGKTDVGKTLSEIMPEYSFVDIDEEIEKSENMCISDIFSSKSEEYFRKIEADIIKKYSDKENLIISIGGGAFEFEHNRENLKKNGVTFYLYAPADTLYERIKIQTGRPLLNCDNPKKKLENLLKMREKNYKKSDYTVDTTDKPIKDVTTEILKRLKGTVLTVNIPSTTGKTYPIFISDENISALKRKLDNETRGKKRLIVISEKVHKLYKNSLNFNKDELFILKDGENQKTLNTFEKIIKKAISLNLSRKDVIISIGGGVAGDMAGYAAASYMRGIDFIQVPTTLLADVDSSVGGKTAINMPDGKNYVGAFYQPKAVYINLNFLKTLDEKQYKSGFGEVIKYAFIEKSCGHKEDFNLFELLKTNVDNYRKRESEFLEKIIKISLELKSAVVNRDEKEKGLRKILNFGHTFGHALEEETKYKRYTHGYSVILGMMYAFNYAQKHGFCDKTYYDEAFTLMDMYGYEVDNFLFVNKKRVLGLMKNDKKSENNTITFILPVKPAQVTEYKHEKVSELNFCVQYVN